MDPVQTTYNISMTKAIEGALADNGPHDIRAFYNAEASASIAFGRAVKFGSADRAALLPTAETDKIQGITIHVSNVYTVGFDGAQLDAVGMRPGVVMSVLRKGRIWARARKAATRGDRLWVRAVSSDTGLETRGGLENADDSTDTIDCTAQGVWLESVAEGELGVLEVDFTNA